MEIRHFLFRHSLRPAAWLVVPAILLPGCGRKKTTGTPPAERPNILFIMTDDHAFQAISAYGHPISRLAPTPNIDRLAEKGMLFGQAFVENSLSTPSRACLMTGLYSHQNGQRQLGAGIDTSKVFFSELLQQAGYQTGVVGKWHMRCEPKGFDYFSILQDQGDYYNPEFRHPGSGGAYLRQEGYATTLITDHALHFLEERDPSRPFCLLVHHKAPHRNWMPEEKYLTLYDDTEFPLPETFCDDYATRHSPAHTQRMTIEKDMTLAYDLKVEGAGKLERFRREWHADLLEQGLKRMTPAQRQAWEEAYGPRNRAFLKDAPEMSEDALLQWKFQHYLRDYVRCIKTVDDQVGRLLDYLEANGLAENTLVVYTSDQGFYMGEHGWYDKRFMYEESLRTPLLMAWPGTIPPGTVSDALVQNLDYAPTFLSLAGVAVPQEMSGRALRPLFDGDTPADWRTSLYYHYYDYPAAHNVRRHDGVRTDRYKLIRFYGAGKMGNDTDIDCYELYDLKSDPHEINNVYGSEEYTAVAEKLHALLKTYQTQLAVDE